jgi:hypothetical protein
VAVAASRHDRATIASLAVLAGILATLLHEGVGHGVTAWLRGDLPTELTSNHLSAEIDDRLVSAGGTIVNLLVGGAALALVGRIRDNTWRYGVWLLAALNLLPGAGYFLFSGIIGVGDWSAVIDGLPHQALLRVGMALGGAGLYTLVVWRLARAVRDYAPDDLSLWIVPYLAAALVACAAGALDPLGAQLFLMSTVPATFGGSSGLAWGANFLRGATGERSRIVARRPAIWIAAAVIGVAYVAIVGPGVTLGP